MAVLKHFSCAPKPFMPIANQSFKLHASAGGGSSNSISGTKWADRLHGNFQFLPTITSLNSDHHNSSSSSTITVTSPQASLLAHPERFVYIPIDFYHVLGAENHFHGDGIRKAFDARVSKPPQYGFSQDALISRTQILQVVCETLANPMSRRVYDQGRDESTVTEVPLAKVPGALCVLQEAGQSEVVLEIGESLLRERLHKSFNRDVVLAMALAYVDMSRDAMALSPPDIIKGCEVLERALKLLQDEGGSSLAPNLQAQISETLKEVNPRRVLELLALPLGHEYRLKREKGLQELHNILWAVGGDSTAIAGGFICEDFMSESFLYMTAAELVDLYVATPTSIPVQTFEAYEVALALVAQALICKNPRHIKDADNLFQKLQQTMVKNCKKDFALERGLCSLLVGEIDKCRSWLGLDSNISPYRNPFIVEFVLENSKDDDNNDHLPGLCKLLETWLADVVFSRFRDTKDIHFKLGDYYDDPMALKYLEKVEGVSNSPLYGGGLITDNIKEASVKILCGGLVVGLLTLFGLKYLPPRNGSPVLCKQSGSAMVWDGPMERQTAEFAERD